MHKIRFIVMLVALCCVSIAGAQSGISVKVFSELTQDLDARVNYPETDQNGQKCALVKVVTTESDFSFDNGQLGVTKAIHKPELSEWWVYLPAKTMKLKIMHPVLGQLKDSEDGFYYFPSPLKEATCYRMELTTGKVTVTVEEERKKTGFLIIKSQPDGGDVFIADGGVEKYVGTTPFQKKLTYGTYNYRVKKTLYHDAVGVVVVDNSRIECNDTLAPAFGTLSIVSTPSGAKVSLQNDSRSYTTPCTIDHIPSGRYQVNVVAPQYEMFSKEVEIIEGHQTELVATLDSRFAEVSIHSLPNATIMINGQIKGYGSYTEALDEGIYDIEVSLVNHRNVVRQVEVIANQHQSITLEPTPIYGSLDVITQPMYANVTINGKSYGDTPLSVENILIGEYEVVLSKTGYATLTQYVTINEDYNSVVEVDLAQGENITLHESNNNTLDSYKKSEESILKPFDSTLTTSEQREILQNFCNEMIYVKGGQFSMGAASKRDDKYDNDEKPFHKVMLSDFKMSRTEVTQELWEAVMGSNPSHFKGKKLPVENVSWNDCQEFIKKLNQLTGLSFRLPTEAEWEFAARGGRKSDDYIFSGRDDITNVAWYIETTRDLGTKPVATKSPNELGFYDMSGNVWEWCSDWYGQYSSLPEVNPEGLSTGEFRVCRGGSWNNYVGSCRVSNRSYNNPEIGSNNLGFRLAISVE